MIPLRTVAKVSIAYAREHAVNLKSANAIGNDLAAFEPFLGDVLLSDVAKEVYVH